MSAPIIDMGASICEFRAFVPDLQGEVKAAFDHRVSIVGVNDNLHIKKIAKPSDGQTPTYEIFRRQIRNDMDSDEKCKLTLLTSLQLNSGTTGNTIMIKPEPYSWFAQVGRVTIRTPEGREKPAGSVMLVNPCHVKLLNESGTDRHGSRRPPDSLSLPLKPDPKKQEESIHQLLEMVSATTRQGHLCGYGIKGLPMLANPARDPLLAHWPLLERLEKPYVEQGLPDTVSGLIRDMGQVAETIAAMHEKGLAHGDIRLSQLRMVAGRPGPGLPERFSAVNQTPGPECLGEKRFIFYNNAWQPPELRFPGTLHRKSTPFAPWQYTSATREGDVWSFGMLLAVMVCGISGGKEKLKAAKVLQLSLVDYMTSSGCYDATELEQSIAKEQAAVNGGSQYLTDRTSLLALNLPSQRVEIPALPSDQAMIGALVRLINHCTAPDPAARPGAVQVKDRLLALQTMD